MFKKIGLIVIALLLSACASSPPHQYSVSHHHKTNHHRATPPLKHYNQSQVLHRLYAQYSHWKGVRYQYGGYSHSGIDCSGFTRTTFHSQFGVRLNRTAEEQSEQGFSVSKSHLRPGDLVFFKTGFFSHHVGIYLDRHRFLHASTSKGVMISSLNNVYWKDHYWKSRRVLK
ncbi:NlpC/P60 family protein [Vibrio profundum]|uniref:NlpC/P60 family protein n=1 Tax=Vibrio profundum TaxID=2910247 RepID=UPI003D0AFA6F